MEKVKTEKTDDEDDDDDDDDDDHDDDDDDLLHDPPPLVLPLHLPPVSHAGCQHLLLVWEFRNYFSKKVEIVKFF